MAEDRLALDRRRWEELGEEALARAAARHPGVRGAGLLLGGSTAAGYADPYSSLDFYVVGPEVPSWPAAWGRKGGQRYSYRLWNLEDFRRSLKELDDEALLLRLHGRILKDPHGILEEEWRQPLVVPPERWLAKAAQAYRHLRQRQASLAWSIRRAQPLTLLDNALQVLSDGLSICLYLEGEPAPGRKWLMQSALRTPAGKRLRASVRTFFQALSQVDHLGGALQPRKNRLYQEVERLRAQLAEELRAAGWDVPRRGGADDL
ncbi:MAG: DUF4037 domain-containing protein [Clostridiales bacterium]|nr:DUF4037 domain-containing protein [Clostridiales bacterium]